MAVSLCSSLFGPQDKAFPTCSLSTCTKMAVNHCANTYLPVQQGPLASLKTMLNGHVHALVYVAFLHHIQLVCLPDKASSGGPMKYVFHYTNTNIHHTQIALNLAMTEMY